MKCNTSLKIVNCCRHCVHWERAGDTSNFRYCPHVSEMTYSTMVCDLFELSKASIRAVKAQANKHNEYEERIKQIKPECELHNK